MSKAYYHLNTFLICGSCGQTMSNDLDMQQAFNRNTKKYLGGFLRIVFCRNVECAQQNVRMVIHPLVATTVELPA